MQSSDAARKMWNVCGKMLMREFWAEAAGLRSQPHSRRSSQHIFFFVFAPLLASVL